MRMNEQGTTDRALIDETLTGENMLRKERMDTKVNQSDSLWEETYHRVRVCGCACVCVPCFLLVENLK